MSDKTRQIQDTVEAILNPKPDVTFTSWGEFQIRQEVLKEGEVVVDQDVEEITIIDAKGKTLKFPGCFTMSQEGSSVMFKSKG